MSTTLKLMNGQQITSEPINWSYSDEQEASKAVSIFFIENILNVPVYSEAHGSCGDVFSENGRSDTVQVFRDWILLTTGYLSKPRGKAEHNLEAAQETVKYLMDCLVHVSGSSDNEMFNFIWS